ncbi:MAG: NAD(P)-binding domain-containing protein [Phycisphaerales bacterium]|nr:NAD(P)-binding domain-containing protein [Phycisphaerales bacterium]
MEHTDVVIVGAGPIGLETAAALKQASVDAIVLDGGAVGNTIFTQFPHQTRFFSSPERLHIANVAMPSDAGEKPTCDAYLAYLRSVIDTLALDVRTFQRVTDARHKDGVWHVHTRSPSGIESTFIARHIVLATGGTQTCRTLGVPGEDMPHVHRFLGDPHRFFRRRVLVVGGRNSAIESALRLYRVGASVTLSYRGEGLHERVKYWLRPEVQALIDEGRIRGLMPTVVKRIEAGQVLLKNCNCDETQKIEVDDILLQLGFEQDASTLQMFGVEVDAQTNAPTFDEGTLQTTSPGVFVAGTATAGTQQRFRVYIETSHVHAARITSAITGGPPPGESDYPVRLLPES